MPANSATVSESTMCSHIARSQRQDPVGTAGSYEAYVVVEVAAPWRRDLWKPSGPASRDLLAALDRAKARGMTVRPLAIMPEADDSRPDRRRVLFFRRPAGPFATYDRSEYLVPPDALDRLVDAYLNRPDKLPTFDGYRQHGPATRDILVCTHGTVDLCCATFGYPIYERLREVYGRPSGGTLRAWRCSHIGGHRFAPTLLDLPDGRVWAHVDDAALEALVRRDGPVSALRRHYRGWAGLTTPFEQAAEREIWEREGWAWTDYRRAGRALDLTPDPVTDTSGKSESLHARRVQIQYESPDGQVAGTYEATVVASPGVKTKKSCTSDELEEAQCYTVSGLVKVEANGHHQPRVADTMVRSVTGISS